MRDHLVEVAQGIWANPADSGFEAKLIRYGKSVPTSPLHEARILTEAGKYRDAKAIYRKLLNSKESLYLHQQLAPLCNLTEALSMAQSYKDRRVQALYFNRVLQLDPHNKFARRFYADRLAKLIPWIIAFLLVVLLLGLTVFAILHKWTQRITTVSQTTVNRVLYVDELGSQHYSSMIVSPGKDIDSITSAVDGAGMKPGDINAISLDGQSLIGLAKYQGHDTYQIYLLKQGTAERPPTNGSAPPVSPLALNTIRSAYDYYLQTHNDKPPSSLSALKPYLPPKPPIQDVVYNPDAVTPERAIVQPDNTAVPYTRPYILVNTKERQLYLRYGSTTLLKSPVGIGQPSQPTPTGLFTVTDHLANSLNPLYGPYIFPLNHSQFAIHGTDNPTKIGKDSSIGCVELPNSIDTKLYSMIPVGTPVIITEDGKVPDPTQFRG